MKTHYWMTATSKRLKKILIRNDDENKIVKNITRITGPSFVELLLSSLFNVVDVMMVGRLSPEAISGVGLTSQPFFLLISVFTAVNVGTTTLVAWAIGSGKANKPSLIARQAILFNFVIGALMTAVGYFSAETVMRFMTSQAEANAITPEAILSYQQMLSYATDYFKIISLSVVFSAVTLAVSASLRGSGQTRIPMVYNLAANGVNVLFNYLLIYGHWGFPRMEVSGAALATSLSRVIACVSALLVLYRYRNSAIRLKPKDSWRPNLQIIKDIFSIGMPTAGEHFVIQGGLTLFTKMLSGLGAIAYAAHQVVVNVNSLAFSVSQAFSISTTTLVGQAVGANDYELAEKTTKMTRRLARFITFLIAIIFVFFGYYIALLFTDTKSSSATVVASTAAPIFIIVAITQFVQSSQLSTSGALKGAGDTMYPLYASIAGILICRLSLCYLFVIVLDMGLVGGWMAFLLDQLMRSLVINLRFNSGKWKLMKDIKEEKSRQRKMKYERNIE